MKRDLLGNLITACVSVSVFYAAQTIFAPKSTKQIAAESWNVAVRVEASDRDATGVGTGWRINSRYVVTNNHVANSADKKITVTLADKKELTAKIACEDSHNDITVLEIPESRGQKSLKLGDSDKLAADDKVIEIGNPLDMGIRVSEGVVSVNPPWPDYKGRNDVQFSAYSNPGNSGSPLFNEQGRVIGMTVKNYSDADGNNLGIAYAVPINIIRESLKGCKLPQLRASLDLG